MLDRRFRQIIALTAVLVGVSHGQPRNPAVQSPRQAIVEMFSGDQAQFQKHLTVEMQRRLQQVDVSAGGISPLQSLAMAKSADPSRFQVFDLGPILFSFNNPEQHERYEAQIESEQDRGEEDMIGLSLHYVRNGMEQPTPLDFHFVLDMKRQEGTWRLNAITLSATVAVGDPRILDQSWWMPATLLAGNKPDSERHSDTTLAGTNPIDPTLPIVTDERPKLTPLRAVRMISMAETIYAQNHPGIGYTCKLADLVNVGRGLDENGVYTFMDAAFADGVYNGYRFTISGCEHKPARTFRVMAEPVAGKGKAYCSDHTNNLRASDDGRGMTCLLSGKLARR